MFKKIKQIDNKLTSDIRFLKRHTHMPVRRCDYEKLKKFIILNYKERRRKQKEHPHMHFFKSRADLFSWYLNTYGEPYKKKKDKETSKLY